MPSTTQWTNTSDDSRTLLHYTDGRADLRWRDSLLQLLWQALATVTVPAPHDSALHCLCSFSHPETKYSTKATLGRTGLGSACPKQLPMKGKACPTEVAVYSYLDDQKAEKRGLHSICLLPLPLDSLGPQPHDRAPHTQVGLPSSVKSLFKKYSQISLCVSTM